MKGIKLNKLFIVATLVPILLFQVYAVSNVNADSLLPPKKQISIGVELHEIKCKSGFLLVLKKSDWSPACVKPSSVKQLVALNWAVDNKTKNNKLNESNALSAKNYSENLYSFTDVTETSGVSFQHTADKSYNNIGAGVSVVDYDKDGWDDIFLPNSIGPNSLYRNNGDMTFTDVAQIVGLDDPDGIANGSCFADFDNDDDLDLFITGYGTSKLYENNNNFFIDITENAGVADPDSSFRSTGCAWGDYDQDGFLDLIVTRWLTQSEEHPRAFTTRDFSEITRPLYLFHNNHDGTFSNVSDLLGDVGVSPSNVNGAGFQPGFFDFDDDGDSDIIIINDFGKDHQPSVLWRNDLSSSNDSMLFTDVSEKTNTDLEIFGMGLAIGDYDNDEDLDLYVTNMGDNVLLQNSGERFTDTSDFAGVTAGMLSSETKKIVGREEVGMGAQIISEQEMDTIQDAVATMPIGWGAIFFDYNNDGFLDLYVVRGHMTDVMPFTKEQPNVLFKNNGDETFADVSKKSGLDDEGYGRGVAYGDFNNDGCLDVYLANIGQQGKLFQNNCDGDNNYLTIKTIGNTSNKDGIGTRIKVVTDSGTFVRVISSGESHMSQNSFSAHFGLGDSTSASSIQIIWPNGKLQELTEVPSNQIIVVKES